jgi:hypothetical protein
VNGPGWRLWLSLAVSVVLGVIVSIVASVKIADANAQEQLRRVAEAKQQATAEQRAAACQLVGGILDAYDETPPPTKAGKNVATAWREEYLLIGCPPRK